MYNQKKRARSANYGQQSGKPSSQVQSNYYINTIQPIYNHAGKVIGRTQGDTFIKHVQACKHMLNKPRGWANDKSIIDQLKESSVVNIEIHDDESGIIYHTTLADYIQYGVCFDRGHGEQICLPLGYWKTHKEGPNQIALFKEESNE